MSTNDPLDFDAPTTVTDFGAAEVENALDLALDAPTERVEPWPTNSASPPALESPPSSRSFSSTTGLNPIIAEALASLKPASAPVPSSSSRPPARALAPSPEMNAAVAQALAGLKPSSSSSSSSSSAGIRAVPVSSNTRGKGTGRSTTTADVVAAGSGGQRPPLLMAPDRFTRGAIVAFAAVGVVVVVALLATQPGPSIPAVNLPPIALPTTAMDCPQPLSHGRSLICDLKPSALNGLQHEERESRLQVARDAARAGGFDNVILRDQGRVWRVVGVHEAPQRPPRVFAPPKASAANAPMPK